MGERLVVLIAEDSADLRTFYSIALKGAGFTTFQAANGEEAKEFLQCHHCDVILSDVNMPHGNGIELYAWARNHKPEIPFVFITSLERPKDLAPGFAGFYRKPVNRDQLLDIVKSITKR